MSEPMLPEAQSVRPTTDQDQQIRERVRELTSQLLQHGRINSQSLQDVLRVVGGARDRALQDDAARQRFAESLPALTAALANSATSARLTLEQIASRGKDFSDNDLKAALLNLRTLQADYLAVVKRIAEVAGSGLRGDFADLAAHAQNVGADAMVGIATSMSELANLVGENAASGLKLARATSIRMALVTSGVLEGLADALRGPASAGKNQ